MLVNYTVKTLIKEIPCIWLSEACSLSISQRIFVQRRTQFWHVWDRWVWEETEESLRLGMRLANPGDFSTPVPSSPSSLLEVRLSMSRLLAIAGWELDLRSPLRLLNLVSCFAVLMDFCTIFFKSKSTVKVNRKIKHMPLTICQY